MIFSHCVSYEIQIRKIQGKTHKYLTTQTLNESTFISYITYCKQKYNIE